MSMTATERHFQQFMPAAVSGLLDVLCRAVSAALVLMLVLLPSPTHVLHRYPPPPVSSQGAEA